MALRNAILRLILIYEQMPWKVRAMKTVMLSTMFAWISMTKAVPTCYLVSRSVANGEKRS
jgi:hypothetical protein